MEKAHPSLAIETSRLRLEPLTQDDFPLIFSMWKKPVVMRYIGEGVPFSSERAHEVFSRIQEHKKKYGYSLEKVIAEEGVIGYAGLIHYELDDKNDDVEVGYLFDEHYWNKGYAGEIVPAIVKWGVEHLGLDYIVGVTNPHNKISQKVLMKSGLHYVGKAMYRGKEVDRFETPHVSGVAK